LFCGGFALLTNPASCLTWIAVVQARALLRTLTATDAAVSREELKKHLGAVVYTNAAGCLRVRTSGNYRSERDKQGFEELLDATRVHPEHYTIAIQIATEATDMDAEGLEPEEKKEAIRSALEKCASPPPSAPLAAAASNPHGHIG
jgi:transcriptional accessory protein Tex/SPT6